MDQLKVLDTKPSTADALRHYRVLLQENHGHIYNKECIKCQRISWIELLIEEAERRDY